MAILLALLPQVSVKLLAVHSLQRSGALSQSLTHTVRGVASPDILLRPGLSLEPEQLPSPLYHNRLLLMRKQVKDSLHLSNKVVKIYVPWFSHRFHLSANYITIAQVLFSGHSLTSPLRLRGTRYAALASGAAPGNR
jgi:hypothetical protein